MYGYRWSRTEIVELFNILKDLGSECTIFVCHVKDKLVGKGDKGEVFTKDISLTGAVADIIARQVDAVGSLYSEDGKLMISFKGNEEKTGGARAKHIAGYEGEFQWSRIFV